MLSLECSAEVEDICRRYAVRRLHAIGSFARNEQTSSSDIDLIVAFDDDSCHGAFGRFMGLKEDLEKLYGREVDMLAARRFRNPLFAEELERTKRLIYAA